VLQTSAKRLHRTGQHPNLAAIAMARAAARLSRVQQLLEYYASIHPADRLPARAAFDPLAIPRLLPNLMLVKVDHPAQRFRVKVVGEAIAMAVPVPLHGRWLDEIRPEEGLDTAGLVASRLVVSESGRLLHQYGQSRTRFSLDFANLEFVHCPLSEDGVRVDHILTVYQSEGIARRA
jgi:hypothetical protein